MRTSTILIRSLAIALICAAAATAQAQAPNTITYQGKLTDNTGRPITVETEVTFTIYDDPSAGAALYTTTIPITPDANGIFTVQLGPVGDTVFDGSPRYLGIAVGLDEEMTPRQVLSSTPYAMKSETPPGIASNYGSSSYITLTATDVNLASASITVPASGYIVAVASAYYSPIHVSGTKDLGRFSISRMSASLDYTFLANVSTPANVNTDSDLPLPVSLHRVDAVSAGTYSYYFVADRYAGDPRVSKGRLVLMFFPESYGAVTSAPAGGAGTLPVVQSSGARDSGTIEGSEQ